MKRDSVILIGCGRWGQNYIPSLGKYWNNVNIFDPDRNRIKDIKSRFSNYSYPETLDDLRNGKGLDVILCVPPDHTRESLKHWVGNCDRILVEKPCFPRFSGVPDSYSHNGAGYIGHIRLQTRLISFLEQHGRPAAKAERIDFSRIYPDRRFGTIGLIPDLFIHDIAVVHRLLQGDLAPLDLETYEESEHRLQIFLKHGDSGQEFRFLYATDSERRDDFVEVRSADKRIKLDDRSNILYENDEVVESYSDPLSPLEKQIRAFCSPSRDEIDLFSFREMISLEEYLSDTFGRSAFSGL